MPKLADRALFISRIKLLSDHVQDMRGELKKYETADLHRDQHRAMAIVYLGHAVDALDCAASELAGIVTP